MNSQSDVCINKKFDLFLSVIIPAYDEEKNISTTLMDIARYLKRQNYDSEIVVVNDGSKDKTSSVVKENQAIIHNLIFLDNEKNHGKGYVVRQGMLAAHGKFRIYVDADNAISIDHLEKFWPYIKSPLSDAKKDGNYDVVIGSIEIPGSEKKEEYAGYRKVLGKLSKYLIRALTIWEIHDTQRAFKLFTADAAEEIFSRQKIMRWGFDIEILVIAKKLGYKIKELPVRWVNPAGGRVTLLGYFNTLKELMQIKWRSIRGKYV